MKDSACPRFFSFFLTVADGKIDSYIHFCIYMEGTGHDDNADIPRQIAEGNADIMITETVEAAHYIREDSRLSAPLINEPFTRHSCGILMAKGDQEWLNYINFALAEFRMDGTMERLENKYLR